MLAGVIAPADPRADDVRALLDAHLTLMRATSPPEDVHALDVDGLCSPSIAFFGYRTGAELLAVGALKQLDDRHGELKSMHTSAAARGHGIGAAMVEHLLAVAREKSLSRVSLETGSMDAFLPARTLYARFGFTECGPFGDYSPSPNSTFMTLDLTR
jgi:putative acetyltransferase